MDQIVLVVLELQSLAQSDCTVQPGIPQEYLYCRLPLVFLSYPLVLGVYHMRGGAVHRY